MITKTKLKNCCQIFSTLHVIWASNNISSIAILDRFPENLGDFREEQGERFRHDIRTMNEQYRGS